MLLLKIITLTLLLLVFLQDLTGRAVYWILFPVLATSLFVIRKKEPGNLKDMATAVLLNLLFLALQGLAITAYFSLKRSRWTNITADLLGWGDILFLIAVAFYFPAFSFVVFYTGSLLVILTGWQIWRSFGLQREATIPLAGLQALSLAVLLFIAWTGHAFDPVNDSWLINLVSP